MCAPKQHQSSIKTVFGTAYHPPLSGGGLGAALGSSPEPWQVSESLVRSERVECQALDRLRISGLFSLHVKDGGSCALVLGGNPFVEDLLQCHQSIYYLRVADVNKKVFLIWESVTVMSVLVIGLMRKNTANTCCAATLSEIHQKSN